MANETTTQRANNTMSGSSSPGSTFRDVDSILILPERWNMTHYAHFKALDDHVRRTAAGSEGMISLVMRSEDPKYDEADASSVIFKSNKALSSNANISQDNDLNEKGIMNEASILNDHHESHYPIDTSIGGRHIFFY